MACRARERVWRCWCSASTSTASAKSPCPRTRLLLSCSSCSRRWAISPARPTSRPGKTGADELLSLSSERHPAPASPGAVPPPPPPSAPPPSPSPEPGPPAAAEHHPAPAARVALPPGAAEVLAELERNSTAPNVGDLLAALIDHAAAAAKLGRFEQVLGVIAGVL